MTRVTPVTPVTLVWPAHKARQVRRDLRVSLVCLAIPVILAPQVSLV